MIVAGTDMDVAGVKFATPRNPDRPTRGTRSAAFARIWLGRTFMPHQRLIADVTGELLPSGLPAYTLCLVTLQRQGGKSDLAMAANGERCFTVPNYRAWYTAQTGQDAAEQFLKFNDETCAGTPLEHIVRTLRGRGAEVMKFPNGSTLRPFPPSEEKLHGKQSDRTDIDEAWAFSREEGRALIQAISPTKATRPGAQTFIWSAGGTTESTWLADLIDVGRRGADPRMAYFELGIPDDADPEDLDVIAAHHPAFGHTITMDSLEAMRTDFGDDVAGWARAAGNRWTDVIAGAITPEAWRGARWTEELQIEGKPIALAAARSEDGTQVAIVAAVQVGQVAVIEVLDVLPTAWGAATHVKGWAGRDLVAVDPNGPSAGLHADLVLARATMPKSFTQRDASAACMGLLDALDAGAVKFRPNVHLDAAARIAAKRRIGDGAYAWSRVAATAPIATMEAAGLALWALRSNSHRAGLKPEIRV